MNKLKDLYYKIKYFIQRGKRGYADCDIWDLDYYICNIMIQTLIHLKTIADGCPPELFDSNATNQSWRWDKILDGIIEGFEAGKKIIEEKTIFDIENIEDYQKEYKLLLKKFNKGMELLKQYFFYLWD